MLIDTHAHLDDEKFKDDVADVIANAAAHGIDYIINPASNLASSQAAVQLAQTYDSVYAAVGVHPHDATGLDETVMQQLRVLARCPKVVAIGEIGLDYYYDFSPRDVQKVAFRQQIRLAKELGLPIVVHDRDAHGDVLQILREEDAGQAGGVLHCFSGSVEMAMECLKMGFYLSFGGPVTFKNARRLPEVAAAVPLSKILVETDSPYLTPEPYRGRRNEPAYVRHVAAKIAEIKGVDLGVLARITTENARRLFGI